MLTIFCALALSSEPMSAFAWWDLGHMTIAVASYRQLDPAVKQRFDRLLKLNPSCRRWTDGIADADRGLAALAHASVWADDIKRDPAYRRDKVTDPAAVLNVGYGDKIVHDYWHCIDIPFTSDEAPIRMLDMPNALTQLRLFTKVLVSTANDEVKSSDLCWILRIVGDLYQPLHATARFFHELDDDRGGDDEEVIPASGLKTRLYLYWDVRLGEDGTPEKALAAAAALPPADGLRAAIDDPAFWLIESFTLAQNDVYTPLIGKGTGLYLLTDAYEARARDVLTSQAAIAAARLVGLINSSLR